MKFSDKWLKKNNMHDFSLHASSKKEKVPNESKSKVQTEENNLNSFKCVQKAAQTVTTGWL